jgi:hypothetical protein
MWSILYPCKILMRLEFATHIFRKQRSVKFHENPCRGSPYRHTRQTGIQTDMTELTVAIHNFANALKISTLARPLFLVLRLCSLSLRLVLYVLPRMSVPITTCRYSCTETYHVHYSLIYGWNPAKLEATELRKNIAAYCSFTYWIVHNPSRLAD